MKVGAVLRDQHGLLGHFLRPGSPGGHVSFVSAMCFLVWMLLTAKVVPVAFVAVEWTLRVQQEVECSLQLYFM